MNWKSKLRLNGSPTIYEGWQNKEVRFCISLVGKAIYLQDLNEMVLGQPLQSYSFDTVENAKIAASNSLKGIPICSNTKDPFGGLSELINDSQKLIKSLKKAN